jgi:prepilin-type N-terminal cleavage/methylation domain-containing protein
MSIRTRLQAGFTLAELLIALAILGIIATFTIPKVLESSSSAKFTSIAKEAASMVSGSFTAYKLDNNLASTVTAGAFTQYLNYVRVDTAATQTAPADSAQTALATCSATVVCLVLHNGAIMQYNVANTFGGTTTTHSIYFNVDPDGASSGAGRVTFVQYYNGRLTTGQHATSVATGGTSVTLQGTDPTWIANWN